MTYCGQGHNRDKAEAKAEGGIPVQEVREEAERDEDEEDVDIGAKEEELVGLQPGRLSFSAEGVSEAPEERLGWLGAMAVFQERRAVGNGRHMQEIQRGGKRESVRRVHRQPSVFECREERAESDGQTALGATLAV